jgi:hypothetical protein
MSLDCLVLQKITEVLPISPVDVSKWNIPPTLLLADPKFHKPEKIDLLIDADGFWELICSGRVTLMNGGPMFQDAK